MTDEYFSWLALDATNEEFSSELTSIIEREQNDWILSKINEELRDHVYLLEDLINSALEEEKKELIDKVASISVKLGVLRAMVESYEKNSELATELEKEASEVNVVYAKNSYGNIMCSKDFEDIKSYSDEKYGALLGLLDRLYQGDTDFNTEKQRPLTSSNKLKGIYELKDYQVRLIYMRESNYVVVIGALVKKDDNDKRYRSGLESMKKKSQGYRQSIRNGRLDMALELATAQSYRESITSGILKR